MNRQRSRSNMQGALKIERLTLEEVLAEAREQGIDDLVRVRLSILEADGQFTFLKAGEGSDEPPPNSDDQRVA